MDKLVHLIRILSVSVPLFVLGVLLLLRRNAVRRHHTASEYSYRYVQYS